MFEDLKQKSEKVLNYLKDELTMIRSGRAQPTMVEKILIEAYPGTRLPLQELASITAPDPHLLMIQPWDTSIVKQVVSGLSASDLHLNPNVDGNMIRISIPALTEERRKDLVKMVKQKCEGAKEMLRDVRNETKKTIDDQKGKPNVSEDDIYAWHDELQKLHEGFVARLEKMGVEKEQELMTV